MAITTGILTGGNNNHATSSEEANAVATDFVSEGVVGTFTNTSGVAPATGAFAVNAQGSPDMTVAVSAGVAYVTATPTSQNSQALRVKNSASSNVTISANSSGSTKYDWLYISVSAANAANPNSAADNVATLTTSRSSSASTDDGTPPTYGYPLAVITVSNGAVSITNGNIRDVRTNSIVNLGSSSVTSGWLDLGYTPNTVTYNGNRSYSLVFNSTDLTSTLSEGMRLKTTRLVAAPTQCTSLNGTTQYYSKSSPAGMTFTDDFTVSAWIKLSSYNGATQTIASRYNGTSGWNFYVNSSGQIELAGNNAGAANFSRVVSYQSVPLNKWVHIAAQLDMSAFTATTTTSYVTFDGVDVPASVSRGGTNPTAIVQAGNLEIGSTNGGTLPFTGKLAQVAIFSAKVTQATMRTYMSQGLLGTETSIISAYSFNNSISDLNVSNANNLTANGSAVATNADSPFGGQAGGTISSTLDYAIVMLKAFSTNTTLTVQVPEGCTIPTSGGVSAVSYSTHDSPYGFPKQSGKWRIEALNKTQASQGGPVSGTWYNLVTHPLVVPIGAFRCGYEVLIQHIRSAAAASNVLSTLSSANNTESDRDFTSGSEGNSGTVGADVKREKLMELSVQTSLYLNTKTDTASSSTIYNRGDESTTIIYAENDYL